MGVVRIHLLGPFEVEVEGGRDCHFESETARAVLGVLACDPGWAWSRQSLAALFWPDRPEGAALGNLRHTLSTLRTSLHDDPAQPLVQATRSRVCLDADRCWVDLVELERLAAVPTGDGDAVAAWGRAADLARGELLADVVVHTGAEWEDWLQLAREHARIVSVHLLHRLVHALEVAGDRDGALMRAFQAVRLERWDEVGHRDVMRLLAAGGDAGAACEHYDCLCRRLRSELGIGPAADTATLAAAIRSGG